jgi:hypothetical protein
MACVVAATVRSLCAAGSGGFELAIRACSNDHADRQHDHEHGQDPDRDDDHGPRAGPRRGMLVPRRRIRGDRTLVGGLLAHFASSCLPTSCLSSSSKSLGGVRRNQLYAVGTKNRV